MACRQDRAINCIARKCCKFGLIWWSFTYGRVERTYFPYLLSSTTGAYEPGPGTFPLIITLAGSITAKTQKVSIWLVRSVSEHSPTLTVSYLSPIISITLLDGAYRAKSSPFRVFFRELNSVSQTKRLSEIRCFNPKSYLSR